MASIREGTDTKTLPGSVILDSSFLQMINPSPIISTNLVPVEDNIFNDPNHHTEDNGTQINFRYFMSDLSPTFPENLAGPYPSISRAATGNEIFKDIRITFNGIPVQSEIDPSVYGSASVLLLVVNPELPSELDTKIFEIHTETVIENPGFVDVVVTTPSGSTTFESVAQVSDVIDIDLFLSKRFLEEDPYVFTNIQSVQDKIDETVENNTFASLAYSVGSFSHIIDLTTEALDIGPISWKLQITRSLIDIAVTDKRDTSVIPAFIERGDKLQDNQLKFNSDLFINDVVDTTQHITRNWFFLSANIEDIVQEFINTTLYVSVDYEIINGNGEILLAFSDEVNTSNQVFTLFRSEDDIRYDTAGATLGFALGYDSSDGKHILTERSPGLPLTLGTTIDQNTKFIGFLYAPTRGFYVPAEERPYGFLPVVHQNIKFYGINFKKKNTVYLKNNLDQDTISFIAQPDTLTSIVTITVLGNTWNFASSPNIGSFTIIRDPGDQIGTMVSKINLDLNNTFLNASVIVPGDALTIEDQVIVLNGAYSEIVSYKIFYPSGRLESVPITNPKSGSRHLVFSNRLVLPDGTICSTYILSENQSVLQQSGAGTTEGDANLGESLKYVVNFETPLGPSLVSENVDTTPILEELKLKIK